MARPFGIEYAGAVYNATYRGMRGDLFLGTIRIEVHRQINRSHERTQRGIEIPNGQSYVTRPSLGGGLGVRELQRRLRGG